MMRLSTVLLLAPICSRAFAPARRIKTTPSLAAVPAAAPIAVVKSATSAGLACAAVGFVSAHAAVSLRLRPGHRVARAGGAPERDDAGRRPRPARLRPQGDGVPGPARPREALPRRRAAAVPGPGEGHEVPLHADDAQDPARRRRRLSCWRSTPRRYVFLRTRRGPALLYLLVRRRRRRSPSRPSRTRRSSWPSGARRTSRARRASGACRATSTTRPTSSSTAPWQSRRR